MKKIFAIALLVLLTGLIPAFAQTAMPRFEIPTTKSSSMGGAHVAYTDNVYSLLVNPAAMKQVRQLRFLTLSGTLLSPQTTLSLVDPVLKVFEGDFSALGESTDILSKEKGKLALGFDLREFPLSISSVSNGFGFGLWNRFFVNPSIIGTNLVLDAYADVIVPFGFAFGIVNTGSHTFDAGFTVKPFARVFVSERLKVLDLIDEDFALAASAPLILGAGVDVGLLYRYKGLSAGITFADIFTRGSVFANLTLDNEDFFFDTDVSGSYYVPFSLNWGVAYEFRLGRLWENAPRFLADTGFAFAFSWRNFTNNFQQDNYKIRNSALDIGLGLQIKLSAFSVRVGMNECLPAVGFGIDLGPFEIDIAYYGRELGLEPGQLSTAALDVTVGIRSRNKAR
jgi:hypothetical protein